ncbi:MarR family transcriptional regulator [Sphaerisporangium melleum]|uniref:MarR family transcriptional regulator n=1 Tax=Sphaerisporangium melleum TaxID=321316 RepID=A0A917R5P4_9ACTN|nr:MarR family transcriptional regulator [Sphaerisporangium melleum]GGK90823.1 MarR family transcriptional regulator [Sphaerisporangium melleum]GII72818.1 MarR family transcriptional regulator [Sphaerisporangium melleum]
MGANGREPAPATRLLAGSAGWLLGDVAREVTLRLEEALRGDELRWRDYGVLVILESAGPLSQQEIGRRLAVDRSTMVHVIDVLEQRGLVARGRDRADRRAYAVELTGAGRALLAEVLHPLTDAVHEQVLGRLTPGERRTLTRLLARLAGPARDA